MPHQDRTGGSVGTAPASDTADLIEFLRCRVAQDRSSIGDNLSQVGPQYQMGTLQQNTVLLAPGRVYAHLDAIERTIDRYEDAMTWVALKEQNGQDTDLHRAAGVAYLDCLRMYVEEWNTHPAFKPGWRRP